MDSLKLDTEVYSVTRLNREARYLLEESFPLIWVEGEISNFTHHGSGHRYFSLKDKSSQIDAVMFKREGRKLSFTPDNGTKVLAYAKVTIYERRGNYQLVIKEMLEAGTGRLHLKFEQLKQRLQEEGLFLAEYKKEIPKFPTRIGLITSPEGAAIRDILTVISRRFPAVELLLFPTPVQGDGAAIEIDGAIRAANRYHGTLEPIDVLIVSRGGGSLEDLWPFNQEVTARAIFNSQIPVITGVGHEVDFTIADFTSDFRAPTPSAAAEACVPDKKELIDRIRKIQNNLILHEKNVIQTRQNKLDLLLTSYAFRTVIGKLNNYQQAVDQVLDRLIGKAMDKLKVQDDRFIQLAKRLETADPKAILSRGYSIVETESGQVVASHHQVKENDKIKIRLKEGRLLSRVLEVTGDE